MTVPCTADYVVIETLNSQLAGQFHVERNCTTCLSGICARVQTKPAVNTLGSFLNPEGRPALLALKSRALVQHNGLRCYGPR